MTWPTAIVGRRSPTIPVSGFPRRRLDKSTFIDIASDGNVFSIIATGAYLVASQSPLTYDVVTPDVVGLTGFPVASRLTTGANDVTVSALGFSGPGVFDVVPTVGSEFKGATRGTTITVP